MPANPGSYAPQRTNPGRVPLVCPLQSGATLTGLAQSRRDNPRVRPRAGEPWAVTVKPLQGIRDECLSRIPNFRYCDDPKPAISKIDPAQSVNALCPLSGPTLLRDDAKAVVFRGRDAMWTWRSASWQHRGKCRDFRADFAFGSGEYRRLSAAMVHGLQPGREQNRQGALSAPSHLDFRIDACRLWLRESCAAFAEGKATMNCHVIFCPQVASAPAGVR